MHYKINELETMELNSLKYILKYHYNISYMIIITN